MLIWKEVWERKGRSDTSDLRRLDGFEATSIEPSAAAARIAEILDVRESDRILEVGCGAGMIAQHLRCAYVGVDYSLPLLARHRQILGHPLVLGEAGALMFADGAFDKAFAYSVFHYFPDHAYAWRVVVEMARVSRRSLFVGDLPVRSHSADHLLYSRDQFAAWERSPGFYNSDRFNALLRHGDRGLPEPWTSSREKSF